MPLTKDELLQRLLKGAETHGLDSEPDHEVGDLQDILRSSFKLLNDSQAMSIYKEHVEIAEYADTEEEVA